MGKLSASRWKGSRIVAIPLLAGALVVGGCVKQQNEAAAPISDSTVPLEQTSSVTLQVADQKGTGVQTLLEASGELKGAPYKVNFNQFTSGPPQVEAASAGKVDLGVVGNTPPIFGAASKAKFTVVAGYQANGHGDRVLVQQDSPIKSVDELKGKKIAVAKGSSAHGNILLQLKKVGLSPSDVNLVFLQPADGYSAFKNKSVDAWAIWDPYTALAETQTGAKTIATTDKVTNSYGFAIAANSALGDPAKNTAIKDFLVRYGKATQWARSHLDQWSEAYAKLTQTDPAAARLAQSRSLRTPLLLTDAVSASEQELANAFADSKQIPDRPEFSEWVDTRYNEALTPLASK